MSFLIRTFRGLLPSLPPCGGVPWASEQPFVKQSLVIYFNNLLIEKTTISGLKEMWYMRDGNN